jgi:hypothetical protein
LADSDEKEIKRRFAKAQDKEFLCDLCGKSYPFHYELTKHEGRCRLPTSSRVVFKQGDEFRCSICNAKPSNLYGLKKHIFDAHSDVEAKSRYNRDIPDLVGAFHMKRIRCMMLGVIG